MALFAIILIQESLHLLENEDQLAIADAPCVDD